MNTELQNTSIIKPPARFHKQQSTRKLWALTRGVKRYKAQDTHNYNVNRSFMSVLTRVKGLYAGTGQEAFGLDSRLDTSFNSTGMHYFCTPDFYLELECGYDLNCYVNYDFEQCRYKEQILDLLRNTYPLQNAAKHMPLKAGRVSGFLKRVKQLHPAVRFIRL